ncbi:MAG TPA: DUF4339 domain-containing protein [Mobilitalea sp.]|nr:DUF4339 domain-containing protein [Mobilitalea sp.]
MEDLREWFYVVKGVSYGPVSRTEIINSYYNSMLDNNSLVWRGGMTDWVKLSQTDLVINMLVPPPIKKEDTDNSLVWILAFYPIINILLYLLVVKVLDLGILMYFIFTSMFAFLLCFADYKNLGKSGSDTKELLVWVIVTPFFAAIALPIYLFRRAYIFKQNLSYAITYCIIYVILISVSLFLAYAYLLNSRFSL